MRLLFAHDHRFYCDSAGGLYTVGSFPAWVWERYLEHFDELHVVARDGGPATDGGRLARSDRDRVAFEFLPSLSSIRQLVFRAPEIDARMRSAVASADAVVARLPSEIGQLAIKHARMLGKQYAVEVVGCAWDGWFNHGTLAGRLYAPLAFLRTRRAVFSAPLVLYVTSSWLQQRYPTTGQSASASNVSLLPIDSAVTAARELRLKALARGERPILGTVASLRLKSKGIQTALAALAQLRSTGLDITYRVLGPGSVEPWQQLATKLGVADLVHFDGTRSAGADVCSWLDDIDIHLQPSFQEGLPRATIEAMSRGVACLGSTCGGIPEILPTARTHEPGDVAAIAAMIRKLASNPTEVVAASRADRQTAEQFHPERLREARSEFFARLRVLAERRAVVS